MVESSNGRLRGRVAVVTGASRGIGRAAAMLLAREGADICVNYAQAESDASVVRQRIEELGRRAIAVKADVGEFTEVREMIDHTVEVLGVVDVLVNNAGIFIPGDGAQSDLSGYNAMFRTNVVGALNCILEVKDRMIGRRFGKIVNVASIAGIGTAFKGTTLYASTKAAVVSLTKRFAFELGEYSINVNAVAPGFVETDQTRRGRTDDEFEPTRKSMSVRAALGRIGTPEDIANAILFLASDEAAFITGQVLTVDGGRLDFLSHSL